MVAAPQKLLCELRDITKTFTLPSGKAITVLDRVNLSVHAEEIVALLGPSGCGKSTLMRILAGLVRADSGQVLYEGQPLQGLNPGVAIVFQSFALYPWLTVHQNIEEVLAARGVDPAARREAVERVIYLVGLSGFDEAYPRELSGGMKQRVAIARALAQAPRVLLMDEPFGALDAQTRLSMHALLLRVWEAHRITVMFITHDVDEALLLSDIVHVMSPAPGRIVRSLAVPVARPRSIDNLDPMVPAIRSEILKLLRAGSLGELEAGAAPPLANGTRAS